MLHYKKYRLFDKDKCKGNNFSCMRISKELTFEIGDIPNIYCTHLI